MIVSKQNVNDTLAKLSAQIARFEASYRKIAKKCISSGFRQLDALLPNGGFESGTLVDWFYANSGNGAFTLSLIAARQACHQGGVCVVIERGRSFYPPSAVAWGVPSGQLVIVRPQNDRDEMWALTQILRCRHVAVVLCSPQRITSFNFRRLQLAAETGSTLGFVIRPEAARNQPSWAKVRLLVNSRGKAQKTHLNNRKQFSDAQKSKTAYAEGRHLVVQVLDSSVRYQGGVAELYLDNQTGVLHGDKNSRYLASQLADPADPQGSARA